MHYPIATILRTTDGGVTWTVQYSKPGPLLLAVSFSDANTGTAVGESGMILRTTNGGLTWVSGGQSRPSGKPDRFELGQNYPNPFNPTTVISYQLPVASDVRLAVFDLLGREVATLVNEKKEPGSYTVTFNGSGLSSGVYFYSLQSGSYIQTRVLLLLR